MLLVMWRMWAAGAVTAFTHPRTVAAARWALASGVTGLVANVLLVLFFALAQPWRPQPSAWSWLGPANDVVIILQFATFIPVAVALRDRLPATRPVRTATAAAVAAMAAIIVLQLLLIVGVLSFEVQAPIVSASFMVVFAWILVVNRTAYHAAALPRRAARFGLLIGSAVLVGAVVAATGLLAPSGSPARYVAFGLGVAIGVPGWLALPVWPLLLARLAFGQPPAPTNARVHDEARP